jgi:dienelactone hydrolase
MLYVVLFGGISVLLEVFVAYALYTRFLKWSALSLLAYILVPFVADVSPEAVLRGVVVPELTFDRQTAMAVIAALEDTLQREPIDPARISLTGLSMGGYGSWDLAARMPERFAAVLPICGGGDEATAAKIKDLPIWCFHGDADTAVRVERSRTMIEALRAAGGAPKYSELAGVGHDSWTPAYRDPDVLAWLFAQKKPAKGK